MAKVTTNCPTLNVCQSLPEGRGTVNMEFDRYEIVPQNVAQKIIEGRK